MKDVQQEERVEEQFTHPATVSSGCVRVQEALMCLALALQDLPTQLGIACAASCSHRPKRSEEEEAESSHGSTTQTAIRHCFSLNCTLGWAWFDAYRGGE